jgi:DNA-binding XRE family transcriptional regulator
MSQQNITRAEIARLIDVSKETVRRHEREWGIWSYRRKLPGLRLIKFKRAPTLTLLKAKGLID